jgi:excisionase family DNA binding protein
MKRLLNINEVSEYLGISIKTLYQWTSQRRIPHFKQGNMIRFDIEELDQFIKARTVPAHEAWSMKN